MRLRIYPAAVPVLLLAVFALNSIAAEPKKKKKEDPFKDYIRKTEPRTPAEEKKAFHLPPGFEIQLVASEPEITKPMNMAFDEHGRLWITESREYPLPVGTNAAGRDAIKILSDFDKSGRARKVSTFAGGLNVPIGMYPYRGGAIGFSIPAIYKFVDRDGDGRSDQREVLYSGQGYDRDTHGLTSAFRRGYDGWLYACHGYNNNTTLRGTDGSSISMNSGNLYRMKLDGSRVEQFTWGQVNPFGMMFDSLGDLFSADCHSAPVYMALRGAYYPSFGKPHDGLGYGPQICNHSHGSTAICGLVMYNAEQFPKEFRGNSFIGNVMTCRIDRDSYVEHGSTRIAKEEDDFLKSDDPWFRPVDLQLGPDGAIYVADFYNRIIGHYEVPLTHPGRDRERGRIWRIVYTGDKKKKITSPSDFDISKASAGNLIKELASPNLTRRMLATDQLSDRVGKSAVRPLEKMLASEDANVGQKVHGLWALYRLGALKDNYLTAAAGDRDRTVRVHAMRVLSETADWKAAHRKAAVAGLYDRDAYVRRAAADAMGRHPARENIRPLLTARHRVPADDVQLVHTIRMALRDQLIARSGYAVLNPANLSEADSRAIADVSLGVRSPEAGSFLLAHIQKYSEPRDQLIDYLRHAGRYAPEKEQEVLAAFVRTKFQDDPDAQFASYKSVQDGFMQRGAGLNSAMKSWAAQITEQLFVPIVEGKAPWISLPVKGAENSENPWTLEKRKSADGDKNSQFLSSRPPGETLTGLIRTWPFKIPEEFSFYLAGHDGEPDHPPVQKNSVRLLSATSRQVITNAAPPRQDEAKRVVWDLKAHAGEMGILEIVDGHDDDGFAWLAVGRLKPSVITIPDFVPNSTSQRQQSAADLTRTVPLPQFEGRMQTVFKASTNTPSARSAAGQALISLKQDTYLPLLTGYLADTNQPPALRENLANLLADVNAEAAREAVLDSMNAVPRRLQIRLAQTLARRKDGAERLMALAEEKKLPATILTGSLMKDRLAAAKLPNFTKRYDKLTKDLPPADKELQKLIDRRRVAFNAERASATRGSAVFTKACVVCHQIGGQGALVGPQLDGAGTRGLERLIEDVLDPSRNVDPGFKYSIVTTKSDDTITGLFRREEGETLVFTDATGKDVNVRKSDVAERRESNLSLMPSNFGEALTEDEFQDLMAFLVDQVGK